MNACNADERAPVSTLALIWAMLSSGKPTHSRQPNIGNDEDMYVICKIFVQSINPFITIAIDLI